MFVKCHGVLEGTERLANWSSPYTTRETWVNAPTSGVSLCLASQEECMPSSLQKGKAKKLKQSRGTPYGVFVAPAALQNKFPLSSKFSRNPGSLPKTYTHVLSTSGKYIAGFLVKSFGGCCASTVRCWWVPLAGRQVTVFLLRRLCPCRRN